MTNEDLTLKKLSRRVTQAEVYASKTADRLVEAWDSGAAEDVVEEARREHESASDALHEARNAVSAHMRAARLGS